MGAFPEPFLLDGRLAVYRQTPVAPKARILMIHGLGEHLGRLNQVFEHFYSAGLEVTGLDLPGHGNSTGPRGHIADRSQLYDDLDTIRARWHSPEDSNSLPEFIYGHSLGGHLTLLYCLERAPCLAGVIASSPLIEAAEKPPLWKLGLAYTLGRLLPAFSVDNGLKAGDISSVQEEVKAYVDDPLRHRKISARLGLDSLRDCQVLQREAHRWQIPLLLMHGSEDHITSFTASEAFAKKAGKHCDWYPWPNARHELHHDSQKEQVFETMVLWIMQRVQLG
jgi:acylglycerol lipase